MFSISVSWMILLHQSKVSAAPSSSILSQVIGNGTVNNISNLNVTPDPRFRFEATYRKDPVPCLSLFMNAVNGQAILAHQTFGKKIQGITTMTVPGYQDASIDIRALPRGSTFENKIAIWGLYGAINEVVGKVTCTGGRFDLFWDENHVATLSIWNSPVALSSSNNSLTAGMTTSNISLVDGSGLQPTFFFLPSGAALTRVEVFMTVLATLQNVAYWNDGDAIYPFTCKAEGYDVNFQIDFAGDPPKPPTHPPYLLVGNVIDVVRQIPGYMVGRGRFADLAASINFDKVLIGEASLYSTRLDEVATERR